VDFVAGGEQGIEDVAGIGNKRPFQQSYKSWRVSSAIGQKPLLTLTTPVNSPHI